MGKNIEISEKIEKYINNFSLELSPVQKEIIDYNNTLGNEKRMQVAISQCHFLHLIIKISNLGGRDLIISPGKKLSGKEIIKTAYYLNKLDYKKYFSINKKYFRKQENKLLASDSKNSLFLKKEYNFKFNIVGKKLVRKMYNSL